VSISKGSPVLETAFLFFGAPVSWLEALAFILAVAMVICSVYEIEATWPLAIVSSSLYVWLFFVSKLYGETSVNVFFALSGLWGWYQWRFGRRGTAEEPLRVAHLDNQGLLIVCASWGIAWLAIAFFLSRFTDSTTPLADGFVTAGSFVGTVLLARKFIENWVVWFVVNAASIALFVYKLLWLTTVLYVILLAMSVWGWIVWTRRVESR
jgi:nicotinamide mononucleotide transporter